MNVKKNMLCLQGGRFRGLTMGFPPLPQRSSARRSFGRSKRLSLARSLDDLEVRVCAWNTQNPLTSYWRRIHVHPCLIIADRAHTFGLMHLFLWLDLVLDQMAEIYATFEITWNPVTWEPWVLSNSTLIYFSFTFLPKEKVCGGWHS